MGFWADLFKTSFEKWLERASDKELSDGYHMRWLEWVKNGFGGNGEKTPEMKMIDKELLRRSDQKWLKNPNRNPNFRWSDKNRWEKD